ncbi:hypothetical protein GYMLUDRAFT_247885 [Collybiopsis luxurians FD-317 M1]|uniref:Uncharacterized protein n=1 Tax=Collybiopsis luxurians FD-317 M1 TaxID=944289 RepID=A0A0D0B032_9AGAR|nr:hypothetical protein GYMLUDRAFT_247885 [Collybiopsis luxurians FD-317 M1]
MVKKKTNSIPIDPIADAEAKLAALQQDIKDREDRMKTKQSSTGKPSVPAQTLRAIESRKDRERTLIAEITRLQSERAAPRESSPLSEISEEVEKSEHNADTHSGNVDGSNESQVLQNKDSGESSFKEGTENRNEAVSNETPVEGAPHIEPDTPVKDGHTKPDTSGKDTNTDPVNAPVEDAHTKPETVNNKTPVEGAPHIEPDTVKDSHTKPDTSVKDANTNPADAPVEDAHAKPDTLVKDLAKAESDTAQPSRSMSRADKLILEVETSLEKFVFGNFGTPNSGPKEKEEKMLTLSQEALDLGAGWRYLARNKSVSSPPFGVGKAPFPSNGEVEKMIRAAAPAPDLGLSTIDHAADKEIDSATGAIETIDPSIPLNGVQEELSPLPPPQCKDTELPIAPMLNIAKVSPVSTGVLGTESSVPTYAMANFSEAEMTLRAMALQQGTPLYKMETENVDGNINLTHAEPTQAARMFLDVIGKGKQGALDNTGNMKRKMNNEMDDFIVQDSDEANDDGNYEDNTPGSADEDGMKTKANVKHSKNRKSPKVRRQVKRRKTTDKEDNKEDAKKEVKEVQVRVDIEIPQTEKEATITEREKLLETAASPTEIAKARTHVNKFLTIPGHKIPAGLRRLIREVGTFLPETGSVCEALTLHILTADGKGADKNRTRCLFHWANRKKKTENDQDGTVQEWTFTGTPYPPTAAGEEESDALNCGCLKEKAILEFYLYKAGRILSPGHQPEECEDWMRQRLHSRLRELVLGSVLEHSGWCMEDVWTRKVDENGLYTKERSSVERLEAQIQRLQICLEKKKMKSMQAAEDAKKAEEEDIRQSEMTVYAEYLDILRRKAEAEVGPSH